MPYVPNTYILDPGSAPSFTPSTTYSNQQYSGYGGNTQKISSEAWWKKVGGWWKNIKKGASFVNQNFTAVDQVLGSAQQPPLPLSKTASPLVQAGGLSQQTLMIAAALGAFLILKK